MTLRAALDALRRAGRLDGDSPAWRFFCDFNGDDLSHYIGRGDPCLTGCLSAMVREAIRPWSDPPYTRSEPVTGGWDVWVQTGPFARDLYRGANEAQCYAAALIVMAEALAPPSLEDEAIEIADRLAAHGALLDEVARRLELMPRAEHDAAMALTCECPPSGCDCPGCRALAELAGA